MPRKVTSEILCIMQPHDIVHYKTFQEAKKVYKEQTKTFLKARDLYYTQVAHLQAILEPEFNDTYAYIENLTPDDIDTLTPQEIYERADTRVSMAKFGRMMHEMGYERTTTSTPTGRQPRWRKSE